MNRIGMERIQHGITTNQIKSNLSLSPRAVTILPACRSLRTRLLVRLIGFALPFFRAFFFLSFASRQARVRSAAGNNLHARLFVCLSVCTVNHNVNQHLCVCVCVCGYLACFVALFHRNDPSPPRTHTRAFSLSLDPSAHDTANNNPQKRTMIPPVCLYTLTIPKRHSAGITDSFESKLCRTNRNFIHPGKLPLQRINVCQN